MQRLKKPRPLNPVSAERSDLGKLTPNHFVLGNQAAGNPSILGVDEIDHSKRYARMQLYGKAFWSRWLNEHDRIARPHARYACNNVPTSSSGSAVTE